MEDEYMEEMIDKFLEIQYAAEEDSFLKNLDYGLMEDNMIIYYVDKYKALIGE